MRVSQIPERWYGRYRVVGGREYRGHRPGAEFVARLDRNAELRAIRRGDILLLESIIPALEPGTYRLPQGWLTGPHDQTTEAPRGASLVERS